MSRSFVSTDSLFAEWFVTNFARNILDGMHTINVIPKILFTAEHFTTVLATIVLLLAFRLTIAMHFEFVSLKELVYLTADITPVAIWILVNIDVHNKLLAANILLGAYRALQIRCLVMLSNDVIFQIPEIIVRLGLAFFKLTYVTGDYLEES